MISKRSYSWNGFSAGITCLLIVASLPGLYAGLAMAQESRDAADVPATLPSTETLPKNYAVITVQSDCPGAAGKKSASGTKCKTVMSRADFEELVEGLNPKMSKEERRDLAKTYSQILALSQEAVRRGLDKNPRTEALLRYARLNILAHSMSQELYRQGSETSEASVKKYYTEHKGDFELISVERIVIPREKQGAAQSADNSGPDSSSEKEMKALAEEIHARAMAGEDFAALQEKAFLAAGINAHPKVTMEVGRDTLAAGQREILELAPGKVSPLLADATGYSVYKVISRQVPALDSIREQVEIRMKNQGTASLLEKLHTHAQAKVNEDYFDKYDPPPPDPNAPDADTD